MEFRIVAALTAISTSLTAGLATVSINAEVSPKSLLNWMGPAPCGNLVLNALSLRLMSLNCFFVSFTLSSSWIYTNDKPGKLMERIPKSDAEGGLMKEFAPSSARRARDQLLHFLRGCPRPLSTRHRHANRNFRVFPLWHVVEAIPTPDEDSDQQDEDDSCRFSVKKRAVLCECSTKSDSDL